MITPEAGHEPANRRLARAPYGMTSLIPEDETKIVNFTQAMLTAGD